MSSRLFEPKTAKAWRPLRKIDATKTQKSINFSGLCVESRPENRPFRNTQNNKVRKLRVKTKNKHS